MTQRLALGITVGAANSVAVAAAGDGDDAISSGSGAVITRRSILRLTPDAGPRFASTEPATARRSGGVLLEGFLARVGDPVDMLAEDGSTHPAADLVAAAIGCLIGEIAPDTGTFDAEALVACHPAWWSRHTVDVQRAALERAGLGEVTLVPEPVAALRWLEGAHGPLGDGAVVVFDLGASGSTVSVLRTGDHASLLGTPLHSTDVAGAEFDLLTMRYVLANAVAANDFDPFDPAVERELSALRERCRNAKEELSINTATVVPVRLDPADPHSRTVRLVRDELEDLLRAALLNSIDLVRDAAHRAGLGIGEISRVLLTGGGGAIPLVAELISAELALPVVAAAQPEHTAARGAALLAADLLAADRLPEVVPPVPAPTFGNSSAIEAPVLPGEPPARGPFLGKRAAVVAGVAVAIGLLATGTLAVGTGLGGQFGSNPPASTRQPATGAAEVATHSGDSAATGAEVAAADTPPTGRPKAAGAQTDSTAQTDSPTSPVDNPTAPAVNSESPAPAPPEPPAVHADTPPQAATPPATTAPAPTPAPTTTQPPPQYPRPVPPSAPSLPTRVLNDTIDGVEDTVGTVLRAPGEVLGGSGG